MARKAIIVPIYNEALKLRFIREQRKSENWGENCLSAFRAMSKYEHEWGADFCTKSADDLTPVITELVGRSVRSKHLRMIIYKDYVRWCIANHIPEACDGMLHVDVLGYSKIRREMVANPTTLQEALDVICAPESLESSDLLIRCYLWLSFIGLTQEEIYKVTSDDVDLREMIIRIGDYEFEICREALKTIRLVSELDDFYYSHPQCAERQKRVGGKLLMRGIRSVPGITAITTEIAHRSKAHMTEGSLQKRLCHYQVYTSGLFYRMHQRELAGLPVTFADEVERRMTGKEYKLGSGRNTIESVKRAKHRALVTDYERWKLAFF